MLVKYKYKDLLRNIWGFQLVMVMEQHATAAKLCNKRFVAVFQKYT